MTILEHIKQLALNLTPEEKDALAEYLAKSNGEKPPEKPQSLRGDWSDAFSDDFGVDAELKPTPLQSRAKESAWIDRHRDEYLGQWVAIEGDTLIAHGTDPREVYLAAREAGITTPFIERVEKRQDAFMGGWL